MSHQEPTRRHDLKYRYLLLDYGYSGGQYRGSVSHWNKLDGSWIKTVNFEVSTEKQVDQFFKEVIKRTEATQ